MSDLRPSYASASNAFGLDATVTVPSGSPVETVVFWLPPVTEDYPADATQRRAEPRRRLVVSAEDVPQVPRGTVILVPEFEGESAATWTVDASDRLDFDHHRVVVLPS